MEHCNFAEVFLHKARRYAARIIVDVMRVIIHRAIERSFVGCARTSPLPWFNAPCLKGKIVRLSVNLRAPRRGAAAAHRAHLLSKRGRREREKIHRYIHKTRPGPTGSCVVKPVRFYDRLLPGASKHTHAQWPGRGISAPRAKQRVFASILSIR